MKKILFFSIVLITLLSIYSCKNETFEQKGAPEYINEVNEWHQTRISRLKEETGWLNLVGLFWLKTGEHRFGSAKDNDIIFPSGPEHIGSLFLKDSTVTINVLPGVSVLNNNQPVNEMILSDDHTEAIRLRDLNAELLKTFRNINRFPVNVDWRIEAKFEKFDPPKKITIPDIIGTSEEENSPGAVVFTKDNQTYRMDALDAGGNRIWFIFADETSGNETYGAGRFLYTDKPDSNGIVILDFNQAYNPPCVFTRFATCPLPPKDNYLKLRITAGEKMWGEHH